MKKFLIFSAIAAAVVSLASCEREPLLRPGEEGTPVLLSLDLNLSGIATKAFAEGRLVDELHVGVYDAQGNLLTDLTPAEPLAFTPNRAQFQATVTVGESYKIAFWAQNKDAGHYAVDFAAKTITANYAGASANDDSFDAFYALYETGVVTEALNANVTLKRPFAQLNVLTPTENVAEAAQRETPVSISGAGMTVKAVKNVFNPFDASLSGSQDVTFAPTVCNEDSILADYDYVEMNYIFADTNEPNKEVTVLVNFSGADPKEFTLSNVPVKRNRRTNILGNVFPAAEEPQPTSVDLTLTASLEAGFDEDPATTDLIPTQGGETTTTIFDFTSMGLDNQAEVTSFHNGAITLTFDKGTNSTTPKYYTSGTAIRLYGGNTMAVSAANAIITNIQFTFGSGDGTNDLTVDKGNFTTPNWAGSESSVTFTVGGTAGNRRFASVSVTYNAN